MSSTNFDVCIRGTGIVGRALALLLGQAKLRVALVEQALPAASGPAARDIRAYALNHASRQLLEAIRCWPAGLATTPVHRMLVFGDAGGVSAFEPNGKEPPPPADTLAWIADVPALEDLLDEALRFQPYIERVHTPVSAPLTAICEGKFSASREGLGITVDAHPYPQHAIATRVRASQPHAGTASQWFNGPHILGLLPLGGLHGDEYAVVWSTAVAKADRLLALGSDGFISALQTITSSTPSFASTTFTLNGPRARWPLRLARAQRWVGQMPDSPEHAWVLLGDAAHTVHPLAGSGLNLGLGDIAALSRLLQQRATWRSVADQRLLRSYERERKAALLPYAMATDGLQWLFWQDQPWLQSLRNWGMNGFASSPFRSWAIRQARHA